jgi:hypothetical protein
VCHYLIALAYLLDCFTNLGQLGNSKSLRNYVLDIPGRCAKSRITDKWESAMKRASLLLRLRHRVSLLSRGRAFGHWPVAVFLALFVHLAGLSVANAAGTVTDCSSYGTTGTPGSLAWALQDGGTVTFACSGTIIVPEINITVGTTIDATGHAVTLTGNMFYTASSNNDTLQLVSLTVNGSVFADMIILTSSTVGNLDIQGGFASLTDSVVTSGLFIQGGLLVTLTNSTVSGSVSIEPLSTVTLTNSAVGGNVSVQGSTVTLTTSTVGGIVVGGTSVQPASSITLNNSTVNGAVSVQLLLLYGTTICAGQVEVATLTNSTVSHGVYVYGVIPRPTINGGDVSTSQAAIVTLSNTTASGGLVNSCAGGQAILALSNSIVAGQCSGSFTSLGYNMIGNTSGCSFTPGPGDLVNVDPMLGPLQDNGGPTLTQALLPGSPAIDAGSPACPPPDTDQRGVPRPQGAACDIGAYEFVPVVDMVTIGRAVFTNAVSTLLVSGSSPASPDATLFVTVPSCLTNAPMQWNGTSYVFRGRVKSCSDLDGQTATVTSSHGGEASSTIR